MGDVVDQLLARESTTSGVAWYLTDHLGSVREVVSSSGAVLDHVDYDAFGNITSESNAACGDRFKYTGREFDATTGLQYNRARYYDAVSARFVSQDPLAFESGDTNLYRYVGNDPIENVDPTGLKDPDFYLGGQPHVWPWNASFGWSSLVNTLDEYQYTAKVTLAGGVGGASGGSLSGGATGGLGGLEAGGPALGLVGLELGFKTGGTFGGLAGLWGGLTAPTGATPGEALQEMFYAGLAVGPLGPACMPGGVRVPRITRRPAGPPPQPTPAEESCGKANPNSGGIPRFGTPKPGTTEVPIKDITPTHATPRPGKSIADTASTLSGGYDLSQPIPVLRMPDGKLIAAGGNHRLAAMESLGEGTIPAKLSDWESIPDNVKQFYRTNFPNVFGGY